MDETPGARSPGMDHILGEDLVGRVDQHFGVFRFDPEIRIQRPAHVIIEFLDRRVALVAGRQEWQFQHAVLREEGGRFSPT